MAHDRNQVFRFLDLPNELQGRIYDCFLEDVELEMTLRPRKPPSRYSGVTLGIMHGLYLHIVTSTTTCCIKQTCRKVNKDLKSALRRLRGLSLTIIFTNPDLRYSFQLWALVRGYAFSKIISRKSVGWLYDRVVKLDVVEECVNFNRRWFEVLHAFSNVKSISASVRWFREYHHEHEATFRYDILWQTCISPLQLDDNDVEQLTRFYREFCEVNTNRYVDFRFQIDSVAYFLAQDGERLMHRSIDPFWVQRHSCEALYQQHNTADVLAELNEKYEEQGGSLQNNVELGD